MIALATQQIVQRGQNFPIARWEVWYATQFGITPEFSEAVEWLDRAGIDPELGMTPVPVAIAEDGKYEMFFPRR
jgi:hypothetical protein